MVSKKNKRVAITLSRDVYKLYKNVSFHTNATLSKVIDYALKNYAEYRISENDILFLVNNLYNYSI